MSMETALDKAKSIVEDNLAAELLVIDAETADPNLATPAPKVFLIGNYLGREEILASIPAVTIEARNTMLEDDEEEWQENRHTLWVWAFVAEVKIDVLHRYMMRYGEAMRRVLTRRSNWGGGWHNIRVGNAVFTQTFEAPNRLLQGCRVEVQVSEIVKEEA